MPMSFIDKTVLLTGAASGLGADVARRLSEQGARLALVDHDAEKLDALGTELGAPHRCYAADVTCETTMSEICGKVLATLGDIDMIVANAGILGGPAPVAEVITPDFRRILEVNVLGVHNTIRPALASVRRQRGSIVVVGSVAALTPTPFIAPYVASKHAVEGYARSLRMELSGSGVHVGIAYLGIIDTPMAHRAASDKLGGAAIHAIPGGRASRSPSAKPAAQSCATSSGAERRRSRPSGSEASWRPGD